MTALPSAISDRIVTVDLETRCAAPPTVVWRTLVDDIDSWWGEPYVSSSERQSLTLDARVGGLLVEDWGEGNGTVWGTVRSIRRPYHLEFDGTFMMPGALYGTVAITIEEIDAGASQVRLVQQAFGAISDETVVAWSNGWTDLLDALSRATERNEKDPT